MFKSVFPKCWMILSILGVSVIAAGQTQATEGASLPQRGSEKYWLVVDEFAERAVHLAYAKRFAQLHERCLADRQCEQYSRIALDYGDELAAVRRAGVSAESEFWNDVSVYSISMIAAPGVPIPVHRTSNYWVTTGSEADDRELRRVVSLEIDEVTSRLLPTSGYSPSGFNARLPNCGPVADRDGTAVRAASSPYIVPQKPSTAFQFRCKCWSMDAAHDSSFC